MLMGGGYWFFAKIIHFFRKKTCLASFSDRNISSYIFIKKNPTTAFPEHTTVICSIFKLKVTL